MDRRASLGLNGRYPIFATYENGKVGRPPGEGAIVPCRW